MRSLLNPARIAFGLVMGTFLASMLGGCYTVLKRPPSVEVVANDVATPGDCQVCHTEPMAGLPSLECLPPPVLWLPAPPPLPSIGGPSGPPPVGGGYTAPPGPTPGPTGEPSPEPVTTTQPGRTMKEPASPSAPPPTPPPAPAPAPKSSKGGDRPAPPKVWGRGGH